MQNSKGPRRLEVSGESASVHRSGGGGGNEETTGVVELIARVVGGLSKAALVGGMLALLLITVIVTVDVLLRTFINTSVPGASEIAGLMQAMMVFLGLAYTLRIGQHIKVDMFVETLAERTQRWIDLILSIVVLLVFSFVAFAMFDVATGPRAWRESSDLLAIRLQPFKIAASAGVGLMCLEVLVRVLHLLPKRKGSVQS